MLIIELLSINIWG